MTPSFNGPRNVFLAVFALMLLSACADNNEAYNADQTTYSSNRNVKPPTNVFRFDNFPTSRRR